MSAEPSIEQNDALLDELRALDLPSGSIEQVHLFCKGGYWATVINHRYLRIPCHRTRCKHGETDDDGTHTWDLLTGKRVRSSQTPE